MAGTSKIQSYRSQHWLDEMPYRALIHVKEQNGTPLYLVAGSERPARKASKALKDALERHGGKCFYCGETGELLGAHLTLDHVDAVARGGGDLLHNLVVACRACNAGKGALPVEAFQPNAGRRWLLAAQAMIRARLALIADD